MIETIPVPDALGVIPGGDDQVGVPTVNGSGSRYNHYALGALVTLLDRETTFVLGRDGGWMEQESSLSHWLERFAGARMAAPAEADFALCLDGRSGALLPELRQGAEASPEDGATALICVSEMVDGPIGGGTVLELQGPGIRETTTFTVWGLPTAAHGAIVATRRAYPLGVDVILADRQGRCVGLPRTTRMSLLSAEAEER
jgi:alpha-D-ribose 1-methylphosphonate 5-triphosphate synthase subunit PhnH